MIKDFINKHYFNLFVGTFIFGIILYALIGFDYMDELCALILCLLYGFYLFKTPDWRIHKVFAFTSLVFLFYLFYSFVIFSNTSTAILSDFVIQIKPYLAFFCVYSMAPLFSANQKIRLNIILLFFWILLLILGGVECFHPGVIKLTMGHVAYYAAAVTGISLCYLYCTDLSPRNKGLFLLLLSIGLISGRAKFFGFYAFASVVVLYFSDVRHLRFNYKTLIALACMFALVIRVSWDKIHLYFIQNITTGVEETDLVARFVLYATSIDVFKDYFPFGSGFGSFATYASGLYYSDIYVEYGIDKVWGINKQSYAFIADTYYPSLAQFGVVGVLLYAGFWLYILKKAYSFLRLDPRRQLTCFLMVILIAGFFAIEGTTDSTFTTHRGFFIMMILGLALARMKHTARQIGQVEPVIPPHADESITGQ